MTVARRSHGDVLRHEWRHVEDDGAVPRRVLIQRAILGLALAVLLLSCGAMLYSQIMSGFVAPVWVALAAATGLPLFFLLLLVFLVVSWAKPLEPTRPLGYHPQMPRRWSTSRTSL